MQNNKMSSELRARQRDVIAEIEAGYPEQVLLTFGDLQSAYDRAKNHLNRDDKNYMLALNTLQLLDWILAEIYYVEHGARAETPYENPREHRAQGTKHVLVQRQLNNDASSYSYQETPLPPLPIPRQRPTPPDYKWPPARGNGGVA